MSAADESAVPAPPPAPVSAPPPPRLAIAGLCVDRGAGRVVTDATLTAQASEIVALLGVNGAGKSSLLQALVGLLPTAAGSATLDGKPLAGLAPERRAALGIGYAPEGRRVFPAMSARDNLLAVCRADAAERRRRVESVYELFPQLHPKDRTLAWQLSGGQQQMLAIGRALMNLPRLLLLDEPTLGLAPATIEHLLERLTWIAASGTTVMIAEQNAAILGVAARVCVMRVGRIVLDEDAARIAGDRHRLERALLGE